ncbi:MAG: hypothetical protein WA851_20650 [Xanthobacteraceae bacterium]
MKSATRLVLVAAAFSVFAGSFSALADDKKGPKAPTSQTGGKGGAKDLAAKGLGGKGAGAKGGDHADGVGGAVGDAVGGTVGGAVGGALGGFLGSLGH